MQSEENTNNFFSFNICHVCKQISDCLKHCSSCKLIGYCSKEHQKLDWKYHKQLCKIIVESENSVQIKPNSSFNDLINYKVARNLFWQSKLKRPLHTYEHQMWMFPHICNVCYSNQNLTDCENCLSVAYCCIDHKIKDKEQHTKHCNSLKLCMAIDTFLFQEGNSSKLYEIVIPHITNNNNTFYCFPHSLNVFKQLVFNDDYVENEKIEGKIQSVLKSDIIAPGATLLYALDKSGIIKNRKITINSSKLTIHLVGANNFEICLNWIVIFEIFFHWICDLKLIEICLIGPELPTVLPNLEFHNHFCENCQEKGLQTVLSCYPKCYNEVIDDLSEPNLVVAFNSGLHEFEGNVSEDNWKNSLHCLVKYVSVPLLITAYTEEEIKADLNRLMSPLVAVILECEKNRFSNQKPLRDWNTENVPVFYINHYISIITRKSV